MNKIFYISSFLLLIILTACESKNNENHNLFRLTGKELYLPEDFTGAMPMASYEDTLVMHSYDRAYNLQIGILNDSSMTVIDAVKRGEAPDEMLDCAASYDKDGSLYILDTTGGIIGNLFTFSNNRLIPVSQLADSVRLKRIRYSSYAFAVDSTANIVFAGDDTENPNTILSEANYKKGTVSSLDFWPKDSFIGDPYTKLVLYSNTATVSTNGDGLYVYAQFPEPYMFIFSIENGKAIPKHWIYDTEIKYSQKENELNYKLDVSPHCIRTWATTEYIYVLHIDKDTEGQVAGNYAESQFGNIIDIFDWNG